MSYTLPLSAQEVEKRLLKIAELNLNKECQVEDTFIKVDLDYALQDGTEIKFKSPADCSQITGLKVYYKDGNKEVSKIFVFADAHGNNVGDIEHLFADSAIIKVILDLYTEQQNDIDGMAFVQNADTNSYLENRFTEIKNDVEDLKKDIPEIKNDVEDLKKDIPDMITVDQEYNAESVNAVSGKAVANAIDDAIDDAINNAVGDIETFGVSRVVEEEGIGCNWTYRKWSSGKCELITTHTPTSNESENGEVSLTTPFRIIKETCIPFIFNQDGAKPTSFACEDDERGSESEEISQIIIGIQKTTGTLSIRLEGLWK